MLNVKCNEKLNMNNIYSDGEFYFIINEKYLLFLLDLNE